MEEFRTLPDLQARYNNQSLKTKFVTQHDLTRRFSVFKNFSHFTDDYPRLDYLHEVIFYHIPRKFVVDIEQKIEIGDEDIYKTIFMSEVSKIKDIITGLFSMKYGEILDKSNFITIDSCGITEGKYKFSVNIVVDWFYFKNYREFKFFGNLLIEVYNTKKSVDVCERFIDPGFYGKSDVYSHFQIRIPGHTKYGENRPKVVIENVDYSRAIVSNIQGCKKLQPICEGDIKDIKRKHRKLKDIKLNSDVGTILELTKHLWEKHFTFRDMKDGVFSFDRDQESFCHFCNEVHHTDNQFYLVYWNGSIWEKCRHDTSGRSKFVVAIEDNTEEPLPPIPVKICSTKLEPEKMFPDDKNVYLIKAHMKMGKTEECIKYINRTNPKVVILLSFRRTFGADMKSRYESFELYSDITGDISLEEHPRIIVQIESLDRIAYPLESIDLVILDEVESIWSQFNHTQIGDFHGVISTFRNILTISKKIICMDADLCPRTTRLLRIIRSNFEDEHNFYKNSHNPSSDTTYSFIKDRITITALIGDRLKSGKKIVIVTNSKKASKELYAWISEKIGGVKIGLYNAETAESKKSKHFRNVNHYWKKYQCLIYTPTVTSGVSFTEAHFDCLFGLFTTGSCNVETCRQMIGRIRNLADQQVYIHITNTKAPDTSYPIEPEIVRGYMKFERSKLLEYAQKHYNIQKLVFDYTPEGYADYFENLAYYIISENIAYDNKSRNSFMGLFIKYLRSSGFEVKQKVTAESLGLKDDDISRYDFGFKVSSRKLDDKITSDIYSSPRITYQDLEVIKTKIKVGRDISEEERNSMAYFKLSKQLNMSPTKDVVKIYKSSGATQSRRTKQYIACRELFDIQNKVKRDFTSLTDCLNAHNYLKDASRNYSGVVHEMVLELFSEIDFGKTLITLMTKKSPMRYPEILASTTREINRIKTEYWRDRLPKFRDYLNKMLIISGNSASDRIKKMDHEDLLREFIRLLSNTYGVTSANGCVYGSPHITFLYDGVQYVGGIVNSTEKILPVIELS